MFLFPLRDDVDVNRQPRGSPFSFFVPSLCLSSSSGLFSPSSSLPIVSSVLVIRVPLSLCRCEKHLPLAHSFQASAAAKASDATIARCNAAVPHCSCSVPVHVSRRCILAVHTLFRGAAPDEFIPENMRRDRAKGERINSTLCSNVLLAAAFFLFFFFILDSLIFYLFFYFFNLCSYLHFLLLFQCDVAITWLVRCAGALAWITARARFAIWRRWMLNMVI